MKKPKIVIVNGSPHLDGYTSQLVGCVADGIITLVLANKDKLNDDLTGVLNEIKALEALETEAKAAKRGLWADKKTIPPWEWRRER